MAKKKQTDGVPDFEEVEEVTELVNESLSEENESNLTEAETTTPPANQETEMLRAMLQEKDSEIERLTEAYKQIQRTLSLKDIELKQKPQASNQFPVEYIDKADKVWQYALDHDLEKRDMDRIANHLQRGSLRGAVNAINDVRDSRKRARIEADAETLARRKLEDLGIYRTELGLPEGQPRTFADTERGFAEGEIELDDYAKARERNLGS